MAISADFFVATDNLIARKIRFGFDLANRRRRSTR
jgi:hypothetical protein